MKPLVNANSGEDDSDKENAAPCVALSAAPVLPPALVDIIDGIHGVENCDNAAEDVDTSFDSVDSYNTADEYTLPELVEDSIHTDAFI